MKIYDCKSDKTIKFQGDKIIIKQYLEYQMKNLFINLIIQGSKDTEGKFSPSPLSQDLAFTFGILKFYTDLDVNDDNFVDLYNNVNGSGLLSEIIFNIPEEELYSLKEMINESIIIENDKESIINVIKTFLDNIKDKIPDAETLQQALSNLGETFKQVNPISSLNGKTKLRDLMSKQ